MYVIVVGCGRVGSQLAVMLSADGHEIAIIDKNPKAFRRLGSSFEGITITGVGFDERILKEAGAERADALAAVTELDNTNLMTAEVATSIFDIPKVISRLYHPDKEETYKKLNIDHILGTKLLASKFYQKLTEDKIISQLEIDPETKIVEFTIGKKAAGKKAADLEIEHQFKIITTSRNGMAFIADKDTEIKLDDRVIAVTKTSVLPKRKWLWG